jgi:transglutaminase-like putative cysteine protease
MFLLILNIAIAQEPLYRYDSLTLKLQITGDIQIDKEIYGYVQYLNTQLALFPQDTNNQEVTSFTTMPKSNQQNNSLYFTWDYPEDDVTFEVETIIETRAKHVNIQKRIPFPLEISDKEIQIYLKETEMINYKKQEIKTLASELAAGETDTYAVAVKLAEWTRTNIAYNLTTLTAEATQSASWVLENRYGVCDELTNLYIALLRSVGIPARFVTGISYTSSDLFVEPWNPHGWAEVYFPEYGWIPFDVTYGQYSTADATHIKLGDAVDSKQASIHYQWQGKDVRIEAGMLDFDVQILEHGEVTTEPIIMDAIVYRDTVSFGSANMITTSIENTAPHYLPLHLYLAVPPQLTTEIKKKTILLKPKEKQTIQWIVEVNENLDPEYEYTFGPRVYTLKNKSIEGTFKANKDGVTIKKHTLEEIQQIKQPNYEKDISIRCDINNKIFYPKSTAAIICTTKNTGNIAQDVRVCFKRDCQTIHLSITEEKETEFMIQDTEAGSYIDYVEAKNDETRVIAEVEYTILDIPEIKMTLTNNDEAEFVEEVPFSIRLEKMSYQSPKDIIITIQYGNKEKWIEIEELTQPDLIEETLNTKDFRDQETIITLNVEFHDTFETRYKQEATTTITITNLTWWQKAQIWILKKIGL